MQNDLQIEHQAEQAQDRRTAHRRRLLKPATISPDGKDTVFDCVLRNLSPTGARLRVVCQTDIPSRFQLACRGLEVKADAQVIWRRGDEMGVGFVG